MAHSSTHFAIAIPAFIAIIATTFALGLAGCGPSNDVNLFSHGEVQGANAGAFAANSGAGGASDFAGGAGASNAGESNAGAGEASGGSVGDGGGMSNGSAGASFGGSSAGMDNAPGRCLAFGAGAVYFSETQHCYLVVTELNTFADARAHCVAIGAHLVTISSQAENAFAWNLTQAEQWIGATDGKDEKEPQPGTYAWITGEPFTFQNWSGGQPNATQVDCAGHSGGGGCFEHCAFQWAGGSWNDRYCEQAVQSICEWDGGSAAH